MPDTHPFPAPVPFTRLQISDGLLMTADLWTQAHEYHRQRQNFYYQALFQPGIIWGLGIAVIPAPATVDARYRDQRWVQLQPGVAIDRDGNPIVVPHTESFHLQSEPALGMVETVVLVLRYSDPTERSGGGSNPMGQPETFSLVETTAPEPEDIELCRINIQGGKGAISTPEDVLSPGINQVDLRYRLRAQGTTQAQIQTAYGLPSNDEAARQLAQSLVGLGQSLVGLYPQLAAAPPQPLVTAADTGAVAWDWVYLPADMLARLSPDELGTLSQQLHQGGTVVVAFDLESTPLTDLYPLEQELQAALKAAQQEGLPASLQSSLIQEYQAVQGNIAQQVALAFQPLNTLAATLGYPLQGMGMVASSHPLRHHPFLFAGWPVIDGYPLQVRAWGGLVGVLGPLAAAWTLDANLQRSRETLRTAQEFGINLMHYAQHRRHLSRLQAPDPDATARLETETDSLQNRLSGE
ncbi:MAG: hypothetical protein O3A14_02670 [Cyanobacteria bacterium]|nr:hypothetical protein [Cyanobacteriota bacterium]